MSDKKTYAHEDYEKIRSELYDMLEDAKDALRLAKEILENSEHPRAVEVYSGLLKNVAVINGQILDLAKTYKDVTAPKNHKDKGELENGSGTTQNVFVGSTDELAKLLDKSGEIIDITPE